MNTVIKQLLSEIISFIDTSKVPKNSKYIKKAAAKVDEDILEERLSDLLDWLDPKQHFSSTDLQSYSFTEDFMDKEDIEEIKSEYALVFKNLPELNEIFSLKELHVEFKPGLPENDIQEIYEFVKKNNVIDPKDVTRYIKPGK